MHPGIGIARNVALRPATIRQRVHKCPPGTTKSGNSVRFRQIQGRCRTRIAPRKVYGLESDPCVIPRACCTIFGRRFGGLFVIKGREPRTCEVTRFSNTSGRLSCKQACVFKGDGHDRVHARNLDGNHSDRVRHGNTGDARQPRSADQMVREAQHPLITYAQNGVPHRT
jgi:hypothetical protein